MCTNLLAQEGRLKIDELNFDSKLQIFHISIEIYNDTKSAIRIYKPQMEDICTGLVKIKFIAQTEKHEEFTVFPCLEIIDLESLLVTEENSVFLDNDEYFGKTLSFFCKDTSPFISRGRYDVQVELLYSSINFEGKIDSLFTNDLVSDHFPLPKPVGCAE